MNATRSPGWKRSAALGARRWRVVWLVAVFLGAGGNGPAAEGGAQAPRLTVAILTFEDQGGKTKYTALVRHWTVADRELHEKMGFHKGWGQCADQLAALVARL